MMHDKTYRAHDTKHLHCAAPMSPAPRKGSPFMSSRLFPYSTQTPGTTPPDQQALNDTDSHWLRQAFVWANAARLRGNRPFGAILVASDGRILAEAFSNTRETGDSTGHAEMNCIRQLGTARLSPEVVAGATLYASAEPCAMCAGAICGAGVRRVVFGVDTERLEHIRPDLRPITLSCHDVFAHSKAEVQCIGPCLVEEALSVYEDSWLSPSANTSDPLF